MRIYQITSKEDIKVLRDKNIDVDPNEDLRDTIEKMFILMHQLKGIGLAAPQVGINKRFFIIEIEGEQLVFINPQIIETSHEQILGEEGCLSVPKYYNNVKRFESITVSALNANMKPFTLQATDLLAIAIQHEYDHLEGKLFIDYLDNSEREVVLEKMLAKRKLF